MKHPLITMGLIGLLGTTPVVCWSTTAKAANSNVEVGLQNFGDLSMFYQALLNTGVINQLNDNQHYTIFAPVNSAFAPIAHDRYPCFYSEQCRPQVAALLRNHILVGRFELTDLVTYGKGIQSDGARRLHVAEPFLDDYTVERQKIISASEIDGNMIYRIAGVISSPQELAQFGTMGVTPLADSVTTERTTVVKRVYHSPTDTTAYPGGEMYSSETTGIAPSVSQTTTVTRSYSADSQ